MPERARISPEAFERECSATLRRIGLRRDAPQLPTDLGEAEHVRWARAFQKRLFEEGLAGIMYPTELGGRGLGPEHQQMFNRVAADYFISPVFNVNLAIAGPVLMECGTANQMTKYIPRLLSGDDLWVQCLSEPSGGSDLAGARTSARRDGDLYRVNGSKMWTTYAQHADYALVLVRTDASLPKHRGLSMVIIPLSTSGVTVVAITQADGRKDYCQEFFDDVEVPATALVGEENEGWRVARRVLFYERNMVSGSGFGGGTIEKQHWNPTVDDLVALARERLLLDNNLVVDLLAEAIASQRVADALKSWISQEVASGNLSEVGPAIGKLWSALSKYRRSEIALELSALCGVIWERADTASRLGRLWPVARAVTIGGGTNEVMRNQIAERVLGLPRDPTDDVTKPFDQTRPS